MTAVLNPVARSVADLSAGVIHASVEIAVPPQRVFQALTDGGEVLKWWGSPDTYQVEEFTADLRVGGRWRSRGRDKDGKPFHVAGEFLAVEQSRLLVQTWIPDWAPGLKTTLTYRLDPIPGGTRLTVRHEGFAAGTEAFEGHTRGWELVLGFLGAHLAAGQGPRFTTRYLNPFRLAAYVLVFFALGHTFGALINLPSFGAAGDAVLAAMRSTHFHCQTSDCTWFGFYVGFGFMVSVFFVASAVIAWYLGGLDPTRQRALAPIAWILFLSHAVNAVLAFMYFFMAPQVFAGVVTLLLGYQCLRLRA